MSSKATSSPVDGSTRFCLIRVPVLADSWWKRTDFGEVAEYILTGTLTSPKLIAPLQIARGMGTLYTPARTAASHDARLALIGSSFSDPSASVPAIGRDAPGP